MATCSKRQCERAVGRMGIQKNLKKVDWKYIGERIAKRKEQGKLSVVFVYGRRIDREKVKREVSRHGAETYLERLERCRSRWVETKTGRLIF